MQKVLIALIFSLPNLLVAQDLTSTYKLESLTASPGDTIEVPLFVEANAPLEGFSWSIDFDETVLEGIEVEKVFQRPDEADWHFFASIINNFDETEGSGGVDEGYFVGGAVFTPGSTGFAHLQPPANAINHLFNLKFRVRDDAPLGDTELRFIDGARTHPPDSPQIENIATLRQTSSSPEVKVTPISIGGVLKIVPEAEVTLFIRGDYDFNEKVELTDAVLELEFLFLSGIPPQCPDAADANDDGNFDISDPIAILQTIFLGLDRIPPPFSRPGEDPTKDNLSCKLNSTGN